MGVGGEGNISPLLAKQFGLYFNKMKMITHKYIYSGTSREKELQVTGSSLGHGGVTVTYYG